MHLLEIHFSDDFFISFEEAKKDKQENHIQCAV